MSCIRLQQAGLLSFAEPRRPSGAGVFSVSSCRIEELREDMPCLGGVKLWHWLNANGVRVGRDELYDLLRMRGLLVKHKKRHAVTTDSRGWHHQYANLVKGMIVSGPNQVWVSDITYVPSRTGFVYLSLVTDAYSRRIMGYHVHERLDASGPLRALYRAFVQVEDAELKGVIHHSDRGCQYCSDQYISTLGMKGIRISMTQDGFSYDNAIAEWVNGILKREWLDAMELEGIEQVKEQVEKIVELYNGKRPHFAIGLKTPNTVYAQRNGEFKRKCIKTGKRREVEKRSVFRKKFSPEEYKKMK